MKNILCFGDSNTFGYNPHNGSRFDETIRWTSLLQKKFGDDYHIIGEGLCGRTTVFQDELREGRRGIDLVGTLVESHNPIDAIVIMLGTNDCKARYHASAGTIAKGLEEVADKARSKASEDLKVVLVSPIHLAHGVGEEGFDPEFDEQSVEVSYKLSGEYQKLANKHHYYFFDAAKIAEPSSADREHLDETGHARFADAIYEYLKEVV